MGFSMLDLLPLDLLALGRKSWGGWYEDDVGDADDGAMSDPSSLYSSSSGRTTAPQVIPCWTFRVHLASLEEKEEDEYVFPWLDVVENDNEFETSLVAAVLLLEPELLLVL
jgi:hypothetical protein